MNKTPTSRHPSAGDAETVIELMSRCEIADSGESDSDIDDLLHDWEQIDPNLDAQLAFTLDGNLASYAAAMPWSANMKN